MRPKYNPGDTIFFKYTDEQEVEKQSFGQINYTTIVTGFDEDDDIHTTITYAVNSGEFEIEEEFVMGRAIIQKPRVRKTKSRKAVDDLKAMSNGHPEQATT